MKKASIKSTIFIFLFLATIKFYAQQYPVVVSSFFNPKYSLNLQGFSNSTRSDLFVLLTLQDIKIANLDVYLVLEIEGNGISIKSDLNRVRLLNPINLQSGITKRISNLNNLKEYFQFRNLSGINTKQYQENLKEGLYNFCFTVFDKQTNRQLSTKKCTTSFLTLQDPPLLTAPRMDQKIEKKPTQFIQFRWTTRAINLSKTKYELILVELLGNVRDYRARFFGKTPLFKKTTSLPFYTYKPSDPQLLPGKKYAWRVRAFSDDSQFNNFKNDGYSDINLFTITEKSKEIKLVLDKKSVTKNEAELSWTDANLYTGPKYKLYYKEKDSKKTQYETAFLQDKKFKLKGLKENTTYVTTVKATYANQKNVIVKSKEVSFKTKEKEKVVVNYTCGKDPEIAEIEDKDEVTTYKNGDEDIKVGDFILTLGEVTISSGAYSGSGSINFPMLGVDVAVKITDLKINKSKVAFEGSIEAEQPE